VSEATLELIDYAVAARPLADATRSGDLHCLRPFPNGLLITVIDGLGHGDEAAAAAELAARALARAPQRDVIHLVGKCHEALSHSRGAALLVASLDARTSIMSWISIGNVEGLVLRPRRVGEPEKMAVPQRGGIVGHRLPSMVPASVALRPGDLLCFATDGIKPGFERAIDLDAPVRDIAQRTLVDFGKASDDALALVARWRGTGGSPP
jgi:phosphoserine phosphatase RsbX